MKENRMRYLGLLASVQIPELKLWLKAMRNPTYTTAAWENTSVDKHIIYNEDSAGCPHDIFSATYLILAVHSVIDPPDIPLLTKHQPTDEIRLSLHRQAHQTETLENKP